MDTEAGRDYLLSCGPHLRPNPHTHHHHHRRRRRRRRHRRRHQRSASPLLRCGLLAPGEWEAMVPGDRHSTTFFWIQTYLKRLLLEGAITPEELSGCCTAVGVA
jgi:hypothetical protein